jgi:2-keto-4-pentenoate hydratase/2-oxohepta-3-ene-1,7-dioic acid hydratase in catechol pathway
MMARPARKSFHPAVFMKDDAAWSWDSRVPPMIYCVGLNYRQHALELGKAIPVSDDDEFIGMK